MAFLYVEEYADIVQTVRGGTAIPVDPPLAAYRIAIGGASAPSPAFQPATRFVRLHTDAICSVRNNEAAPVADPTIHGRWAANQTEFRGVTAGAGNKVAVITNT